jgi:hypothetical protein
MSTGCSRGSRLTSHRSRGRRPAARARCPGFDTVVARDAGRALGAAVHAQLITGTNANGQTLGLVTVTGIKTVTATDACPTSQEVIAKFWTAYDQIANGGYGVADVDRYATVLYPSRLAFLYNNAQAPRPSSRRSPAGSSPAPRYASRSARRPQKTRFWSSSPTSSRISASRPGCSSTSKGWPAPSGSATSRYRR